MSLQPIETIYKGYRFRSRLEARWAVFFDALGIPYDYEPEGFDLGGIWYLPDFLLTKRQPRIWVEIKPEVPKSEEECEALLTRMIGLCHQTALSQNGLTLGDHP
jgi:hypothetical protein